MSTKAEVLLTAYLYTQHRQDQAICAVRMNLLSHVLPYWSAPALHNGTTELQPLSIAEPAALLLHPAVK